MKRKNAKRRAIASESRKLKRVKRHAKKKIKHLVHRKSKKHITNKIKHRRYKKHLIKTEKIKIGKKKRYSPHFANRVRELDLYIHNSMHKNYSDEAIIKSLADVGWPRQFVEKRLKEIHGFEKKKINLGKEKTIPKHLEPKKKTGILSGILGKFHKPKKPKEHPQEKKDAKIKIKFKKKETEAIRAIKSSLREKNEFKTDLDRLYNLLQQKKEIRISEIATGFNISKKQAEEWCRILEENELAVLHYPTIGEPVLKCK